jgi:ABC-2 type transport system permease protein
VQFFRVFWIPAWVIVPLLTMKSLAEERRSGTLESLLTTPVKASEVVLAKYGASYLFYVFLWFSTAGFLFILHRFAKDARFLDTGPLIGGYAFIAVTSLFYVAIGILASALTRSQAVAGILAFVTLAGVTLGPLGLNRYALPQQTALQPLQNALGSIDVWQHLDDFTRGVVDTRQIVFYCTATALALILSILSVEGKILRS